MPVVSRLSCVFALLQYSRCNPGRSFTRRYTKSRPPFKYISNLLIVWYYQTGILRSASVTLKTWLSFQSKVAILYFMIYFNFSLFRFRIWAEMGAKEFDRRELLSSWLWVTVGEVFFWMYNFQFYWQRAKTSTFTIWFFGEHKVETIYCANFDSGWWKWGIW